MHNKKRSSDRSFNIFLAGQFLENLAESVRFIAVTTLIFRLSGSGISAAAGVALSALPGIFASPFAGIMADKAKEGRVLILIDIMRFFTVPLFLHARSIVNIYLLLVIISFLDVFYNPSRKKYVLGITGKEGALKANSLLTGAAGAAYLAGPVLSGYLTDTYGPAPSIIIASLCCLISDLLTFISVILAGRSKPALFVSSTDKNTLTDIAETLHYCRNTAGLWELLTAGIIIGFGSICVNLAFYPFAFDVIKVTARGWSLMITIYYGTNLLAVFLTGYLSGFSSRAVKNGRLMYGCLAAVSLIWMMYSLIRNYTVILLLQFIEGMAMSVAGIILAARFQILTDNEYMGRVTGLGDVLSSAGKLAGMACTAVITAKFSPEHVFVFCSILLLSFSLAADSLAAGFSSGRTSSF